VTLIARSASPAISGVVAATAATGAPAKRTSVKGAGMIAFTPESSRRVGVELRDARVCVRAAQHACVKHAGQTLIVRVTRDAGRFQWTIDTRVA
jgi:hypothetical protein